MTQADHGDPRTILLIGAATDSGNKGCRALTSSLIGLLASQNMTAACVTSGHPVSEPGVTAEQDRIPSISYLRYRWLPHKLDSAVSIPVQLCMAIAYRVLPVPAVRRIILNRSAFIRAIVHADLVGDIREGDSFSDIYGLKRLLVGSVPALTAIMLGKDLVLLPQTYGPYRSRTARLIARFILRHARLAYSRCRQGIDEVRILSGVTAEFCPDVAFMLESRLPDPLEILPPLEESGDALVGLNLSGLLYHGCYGRNLSFGIKLDYREWVHDIIEALVKDYHVMLVPHVHGSGIDDDLDLCRTVFKEASSRHGNRIHLVEREYGESEMKGIIGLCEFFIGSRMHACIAALSQGIPAIGVAYSDKFRGVFDSVGVGDHVLDARRLTGTQALDFCIERLQRGKETRELLDHSVEEARNRIQRTFGEIAKIAS